MHLRTSCVVAVSLFFWIAQAYAATQDPLAFDRGVAAFGAGDYAAALESFLEAQRAGLETPGLHYNLGATYYKLQRYAESEREFQELARDSAWAPLASYNLGLIAQRTGRPELAKDYFERALTTSPERDLRALAGVALGRLQAAVPTRMVAVASLAGGYDSNATLTPDAATAGTSHQSDLFIEALGAASYRLSGSAAGGLDAQAGFLLRRYEDLREFDQTGGRLGLSYETVSSRWQTVVGGFYDTIYVGGDPFQRTGVIEARVRRVLDSGGELRGRYEYQRIEGGGGFEYLDGWEQQLSLDAGFVLGSTLLRAGYQLELNNRRGLEQGADFLSYSPTRNSVFATVFLPNLAGWWVEARGEYRTSRYDEPYRINGVEIERIDKRFGIAARTYHRLAGPWRVFIDYSYYRNASTIDTFDYNRTQVMAGIEISLDR